MRLNHIVAAFAIVACLAFASSAVAGSSPSIPTGACCDEATATCTDGETEAICEVSCPNDPSRTLAVGSFEICRQFDDNKAACEAAFIIGGSGVASCWFDARLDYSCSG